MKKAKKLIIGNWKMNPVGLAEAKKNVGEVKRGLRSVLKTEVVFCPPVIFLGSLQTIPTKTVFLGAQDAHFEPMGAYTGEVSFTQLADFKVSHVIVGHSECRMRGDTDEIVNKKVRAVVGEGMTAIVCIGEGTRDKDGNYLEIIRSQIISALQDINKKSLDHVVIAYEPVWAIGAQYAMTPRDVHETAIFILKVLRDMYGILADSVRILYGGSVDILNAKDIVKEGNVAGLLIGRASLKPQDFLQIIKDIDSI